MVGILLFALSFFLVGTSPMLRFADNWRVIYLGMVTLGFATSTIIVPLIPEVLDRVVEQLPHLKSEELNNVIAGYFTLCVGIGQASGPVSAGILVESFGFRSAIDIVGSTIVFYAMMYFMVNILIPLKTPKNDEMMTKDDYARIKDFESSFKSDTPTFDSPEK